MSSAPWPQELPLDVATADALPAPSPVEAAVALLASWVDCDPVAYARLIAPGETPQRAAWLALEAGGGLVVRAWWIATGALPLRLLGTGEVLALLDREACARGAVLASGDLPRRGDVVYLAGHATAPQHLYTVEAIEEHVDRWTVQAIEGIPVDGQRTVARREHALHRRRGALVDAVGGLQRAVWRIYATEQLLR